MMLYFLLVIKMTPQFVSKKIGRVGIFELKGVFSNSWVPRIASAMNQIMESSDYTGLLFNLRGVEKVDDSGAESLLRLARRQGKCGIWGHNRSAYFIAEHMNPQEAIPVFENGEEVIHFFAREFASPGTSAMKDRRKFPRLQTAFPVDVEISDFGQLFIFEAVVTNLSEGGFFGHYLDTETEEMASRVLDPFDLKMMKLTLRMDKDTRLTAEGKLLRTETESSESPGLAVEFYNLDALFKETIRSYLENSGKASSEGGKNNV